MLYPFRSPCITNLTADGAIIRDFSGREVSDEALKRIISAAFKAPANDHLRQFEFVVVRGQENIAKVIAPLAKNMAAGCRGGRIGR